MQIGLTQVPDNMHVTVPSDFQWMDAQEFENCGKPVLLLNLITDNLILHEWLHI
jgi:hypothetical protein